MRIRLPYDRPPLSMNQRMHWAPKAKLTKTLREQAHLLTSEAISSQPIPVPPIVVDLVWIVTDNRRRDSDNPAATRKPVVDGVCEALGVDDDWRVVSGGVRIEKGLEAGLWVEVLTGQHPDEVTA